MHEAICYIDLCKMKASDIIGPQLIIASHMILTVLIYNLQYLYCQAQIQPQLSWQLT